MSVAGDERSEEQRKRGARVSDVWVRVVFVHNRNRRAPPKAPSLKHPTNVPRCSLDSTCRWHMCTECPASPRGSGRTGSGCTNTSVCGGASVCVSVSVCARGGEGLPTYPPTHSPPTPRPADAHSHHPPTYTHTLTRWLLRHDEPKSITLMALRLGWHSKMFSGLRSQWMMFTDGCAKN